jgi:TctA family transporter
VLRKNLTICISQRGVWNFLIGLYISEFAVKHMMKLFSGLFTVVVGLISTSTGPFVPKVRTTSPRIIHASRPVLSHAMEKQAR